MFNNQLMQLLPFLGLTPEQMLRLQTQLEEGNVFCADDAPATLTAWCHQVLQLLRSWDPKAYETAFPRYTHGILAFLSWQRCAAQRGFLVGRDDSFIENSDTVPEKNLSVNALSEKPVLDEALVLSASALNTYAQCPRRFYYRYVLNLTEPETPQAFRGTLLHALLEVQNRVYAKSRDPACWTPVFLNDLLQDILEGSTPDDTLLAQGISPALLAKRQGLSLLDRLALLRWLSEAIADLGRKGYFDVLPKAVFPEYSLDQIQLPGVSLPVSFKGRVDLLRVDQDPKTGQDVLSLIDYKVYQAGRYGLKTQDSLPRKLLAQFEAYPEVESNKGGSHTERFKGVDGKPRDFQFPLYYAAVTQLPEFQEYSLAHMTLQVVRPQFPDNPEQGAIPITIYRDEIAPLFPTWVAETREHVLEPLMACQQFAVNPGRQCEQCHFQPICLVQSPGAEVSEGEDV